MKTRVFSRPIRGALAGVAMIGIAGFAAAQMNDHKDHPAAATQAAPADRKIKYYPIRGHWLTLRQDPT